MITILGSTLVNRSALGKIILAALIGGTGVVIVFGFLLLGISRGRPANSPTQRFALFALSGVCVAGAAIGIYAMTQKPSTAKPKPKPKPKAFAALAHPPPHDRPPSRVTPSRQEGSSNLRGLVATRCASYEQRYNAEIFPDIAGAPRGDDHHPPSSDWDRDHRDRALTPGLP